MAVEISMMNCRIMRRVRPKRRRSGGLRLRGVRRSCRLDGLGEGGRVSDRQGEVDDTFLSFMRRSCYIETNNFSSLHDWIVEIQPIYQNNEKEESTREI